MIFATWSGPVGETKLKGEIWINSRGLCGLALGFLEAGLPELTLRGNIQVHSHVGGSRVHRFLSLTVTRTPGCRSQRGFEADDTSYQNSHLWLFFSGTRLYSWFWNLPLGEEDYEPLIFCFHSTDLEYVPLLIHHPNKDNTTNSFHRPHSRYQPQGAGEIYLWLRALAALAGSRQLKSTCNSTSRGIHHLLLGSKCNST